MLKVGAHTEVLRGFRLVEPVLSLDVVLLLLLGVEGATEERNVRLVGDVAGDAQGAEVGEEAVFLVTIEIDTETLHVLLCSEGRLTVFRREVVMVVRDVADEIYLPSLVGRITQIGLIIQEVWLVFTLCVGGSK